MNFLIGLAAKAVGEKFAPLLAYGGVVLLLFLVLWWLRADAYSDGVDDTDARWEQALEDAEEASEASAGQADENAEPREQGFAEAVREEKEKLDEAANSGGDTFDVLFDTFSVSDDQDGG